MKKILSFSAALAAFAAVAAPVVSDVTLSQSGSTVTIGYTLSGEPGIVTVDIQTNVSEGVWETIGGEHLTFFAGDANRLVQPGARTITWKPRKAWPDNEVKENVKAVVSAWATNAPPDYMVVSLSAPNSVFYYTSAGAVPFGVTNDLYKTEWLVMRKCPAANVTYRMGSPSTEVGRYNNEAAHLVTFSEDYYIGVYEVTQRQYELLTGEKPSYFNLDTDYATRPVEQISFETFRGSGANYVWPTKGHAVDSKSFIGKVRTLTGLKGIDLPTEAQWEFASRAGCGSALYSGQELESATDTVSARLDPLARYKWNGGKIDGTTMPSRDCTAANGTAKVGSYAPNAWGIYDTLGNVAELCLDWYQASLTGVDPATGPESGTERVMRGSRWDYDARKARCAYRAGYSTTDGYKDIGFRLACPAE